VPVVFPQFGPGVLPQHGFARNTLWTVGETSVLKASGDISQAFILEDSPATRAVYPHHFRLTLTVLLKPTALSMQLRIQNLNSDARPMSFTTLLHTYLRVDDINKTSVRGLKGRQYVDKVDGEKIKEETGDEIRFLEEIDRMYINGGAAPVSVRDGGNCELKLMTTGFSDYVVWNPSAGEKIKAMADMPDDGFETFVCVEAGSVCEPVTLEAGKEWTGVQGISLSLLPDTAAKVAEKQLAGSGKL
jgi:glucose-6-phosphate 1-epimerase